MLIYYNIVCPLSNLIPTYIYIYIIQYDIGTVVIYIYSIVGTSCVCVRALTFWIVNDYNNLCLNPDLV